AETEQVAAVAHAEHGHVGREPGPEQVAGFGRPLRFADDLDTGLLQQRVVLLRHVGPCRCWFLCCQRRPPVPVTRRTGFSLEPPAPWAVGRRADASRASRWRLRTRAPSP